MFLMQDNGMLVDEGLLNPLSIVAEVSSHCDLIIAIFNSTNHRHYQLPVIPHPPALKAVSIIWSFTGRRCHFGAKWQRSFCCWNGKL